MARVRLTVAEEGPSRTTRVVRGAFALLAAAGLAAVCILSPKAAAVVALGYFVVAIFALSRQAA